VAKITAIRLGKGHSKRARILLDGRAAFSLEAEVAVREGLAVGQELSESRIEALTTASHQQRCHDTAIRFLGYRPRSEQEMKQRLGKHNFDEDTIKSVLARLKEEGLINDADFAAFWRDNRQSFSPRSQWLTRLELRQKGVPEAIIEQAVSNIDDADNAYRVGESKAQKLKTGDYQDFRRRLGDYLKRRGFGYGVIIKTIDRLWHEREELLPEQ
jgi:regulatory protein